MEINLNKIFNFRGPYENIRAPEPFVLKAHDILYLGEMTRTEKAAYSLYTRSLDRANSINLEVFGKYFATILDDDFSKIKIDGTKKELRALEKIKEINEEGFEWFCYLEDSVYSRFAVQNGRFLLFLPKYSIFSFSFEKIKQDPYSEKRWIYVD